MFSVSDPRSPVGRLQLLSSRFSSSASGFAFAGLVAAAASVISGPIIGRALGADGKGKVATVTTAASLLVLVLGLGFPVAARKKAAGGHITVRRTMALGARVSTYGVPAAIAAAAAAYWFGPLAYTGADRQLMFVMFLVCPLGVLRGFGAACLTATGQVSKLAALRSAPPLALSLASVTLAVIGHLTIITALILAVAVVFLEVVIAVRPVGVSWREPFPALDLLPFSLKALP